MYNCDSKIPGPFGAVLGAISEVKGANDDTKEVKF